MKSPFSDLPPEEQRALIKSMDNGEAFYFHGEEQSPIFGDNRHTGLNTCYHEVAPEQLVDVAKHLSSEKGDHKESIARAYALICEAHLASRNIKHWNEKVRRHHINSQIDAIVKEAIEATNGKLEVGKVLVTFFKAIERPMSERKAKELFNEWIQEAVRLRDLTQNLPTSTHGDSELFNQLIENGWLRYLSIGSSSYLIPPEATKPKTPLELPLIKGQHPTTPYWNTTDAWWPEAGSTKIKAKKAEHLKNRNSQFASNYQAGKALEKFHQWLRIQEHLTAETARKVNRSAKGKFVSPSDKGSQRGEDGKFS